MTHTEVLGSPTAPAVLLLHPWWGVTPAVRWWAEQLVKAGRRVVLPDLYDGTVLSTAEAAESFQQTTDQAGLLAAVETEADALAAEGRPWAAMGFSMGASFACQIAGRGAKDPAELVLFYGGWKPRSPDVGTRSVDLHVPPSDPWMDDEELDITVSGFTGAGAEVAVHTYEGCGHWFAEAGSPGYDAAGTAMALTRVLDRLAVRPGQDGL